MSQVPRYLARVVQDDALAKGKMALISGPRQVGKTTLAKSLLEDPRNYFLLDDEDFRRRWVKSPAQAISGRGPGAIVLDEIHKDRKWKTKLKGIYDLRGREIPIVVTGSARLEHFRKGGDSLLGRYLPYRLFPFTVGESASSVKPDEILCRRTVSFPWADILRLGGFPEPLLGASEAEAKRWSRLRIDRLVFEDSRDVLAISDVHAFRVLIDLLPERVGSLLSVNSLREDTGKAYATVRSWLARALHLLKACCFWTDTAQGEWDLRFVRTKEKREVDFLILRDGKPWMLVECKSGEIEPVRDLVTFTGLLKPAHSVQLVCDESVDRFYPEYGIRVMGYQRFLSGLLRCLSLEAFPFGSSPRSWASSRTLSDLRPGGTWFRSRTRALSAEQCGSERFASRGGSTPRPAGGSTRRRRGASRGRCTNRSGASFPAEPLRVERVPLVLSCHSFPDALHVLGRGAVPARRLQSAMGAVATTRDHEEAKNPCPYLGCSQASWPR